MSIKGVVPFPAEKNWVTFLKGHEAPVENGTGPKQLVLGIQLLKKAPILPTLWRAKLELVIFVLNLNSN